MMVRGANTTSCFWLILETTILLESLRQEKVLTTLAVRFTQDEPLAKQSICSPES